ncbi:MAG TPA: gephyrin-like molybdotransferase Glp [Dongiaceae bacterium]|nr:gephyrin-like molybdotransferase Glp [Dongiaceae bacterium]
MSHDAALNEMTAGRQAAAGGVPGRRLTLEEAQSEVRRCLFPVAAKALVPAAAALNRILASDLTAPVDLPMQDRSALDGYAFRAADLPQIGAAHLRVTGQSAAGHPHAGTVEPGCAVRILTGGSVPAGLDTVIMQERCTADGGIVSFLAADVTDRHVRFQGEDYRAGATILPRGRRIRPVDLGAASACGFPVLPVYEPLRLALFSTGDELVEPGLALAPGQIWDANRAMLKALIGETGATVNDLGILPDNLPGMLEALSWAARDHDMIITSGGMSVGDEDHVRQVIQRRGRLEIWRLAIKPGKPVGFGDIDDCPILALPGNPVAAVVTFLMLGRAALNRLSGSSEEADHCLHLPAATAITKQAGRREFRLAKIMRGENGASSLVPAGKGGSAMLSALVEAQGLIDLDEASSGAAAGEILRYLPLRQNF